ncbi:MAG TPA: ABC transporter substrate-binding protein [Acidimicrobiales bacterium]|jgi:iron complex transport system substrate-binding protein|nr:ABC transporter substrate-binding protein [Acidimicrobiales bacterium]
MQTIVHKSTALLAASALALGALVAVGATGAAAAPAASKDYAPQRTFPMTITTPAGTIHLAKAPTRIVSLSPTATEILYAIGAGKRVIAVDTDSNYPTKGLPTTRFNAFSPNVEQLIALHPTLVVVSYNPNNLESQLASAGIPVMEQDAASNLRGTTRQITWLGNATGHYEQSYDVASADTAAVAKDIAKIPKHHPTLRVYYELDPTLYSLTSSTYAGGLLKSLGVTNIADPLGTTLNGGYPQLTAEYVIGKNPQMVFLADTVCCHQSYATVAARAGFSVISAVKHHEVIKLNDDVASRWGPRVSILMDQLTAAVLRYDKA